MNHERLCHPLESKHAPWVPIYIKSKKLSKRIKMRNKMTNDLDVEYPKRALNALIDKGILGRNYMEIELKVRIKEQIN